MKILLNRCHGGFDVSPRVLYELIKIQSPHIDVYKKEEWFDNEEDAEDELKNFKDIDETWAEEAFGSILYNKINKLVYRLSYKVNNEFRIDPQVIDIFNKLGSEAFSGSWSKIQLIEIPDNIIYTVQEYDGLEWVAEKHRTWPE